MKNNSVNSIVVTKDEILGLTNSHILYLDERIGIHRQMLDSWQRLQTRALDDGINLSIASGFRDFNRQLSIWNRKCLGQLPVLNSNEQVVDLEALNALEKIEAIMLFSALPGTSRHHWGTDVDVFAPNMLNENYQLQLQVAEYEQGGPLFELNQWLTEHASSYGFYRPYDKYRAGVFIEPWHLSYHPLASQFEQSLSSNIVKSHLVKINIEEKEGIVSNLDRLFSKFVTNIGDFSFG